MSGPVPLFDSLIVSISTALSSNKSPKEKAEYVADLIAEHLSKVNVTLSLQTPVGQEAVFTERHSPDRLQGRFLFVRQIQVRGKSYGRFTLEADLPGGGAADWLCALETVTQQLAVYAERLFLESANDRLQQLTSDLAGDLRAEKLIARAGGILARTHNLTHEAARQRIVNESRKRGLSVPAVADQIILHQLVQRDLASPARVQGAKEWAVA